MARYSTAKWPASGPVRDLLAYLSGLHQEAGHPSLTEIGRAVALAPSTLSAFFTGARLIGRGNLELLVEHLGGDAARAERLRRRAAAVWKSPAGRRPAAPDMVTPEDAAGSRIDIALFDTPTNRLNRPARFVGRDRPQSEIDALLDRGEAVLLYGLAGAGKTALAATVADGRVAAGAGAYIWLRPAGADAEAAIDGLVRLVAGPIGREYLRSTSGDGRLKAIQEMVSDAGVRLLVIDDVSRPDTLHMLLRTVPDGAGALVTSRLKLGVDHQFEVGELDAPDAVDLLAIHAGVVGTAGAAELCRDLGHHPYAVEIAGRHLRQYGATAAELRGQLHGAPHELTAPAGYAAPERASVRRLLDRTCAALGSADARSVLRTLGTLYSGSATVELLATCLGFDPHRTRTAANALVDVSLARRVPATSAYQVHDLTYSYARGLGGPDPVPAVAEFARLHAHDSAVLAADLDNLLGAAAAAAKSDPEAFTSIVQTLAVDGYLDSHGHTFGLLRLIEVAVERARPEPGRCHTLLTKLGNAYYNEGDCTAATHVYDEALALAPSQSRRAVLLSLLGKVRAESGDHSAARADFDRAYAVADATGDPEVRMRVLEQHSVAAFRRRDYGTVRDVAREGLGLSQELGLRFQEAIFLNNLGTAEFELGVCAAVELHTRAQAIAVELGNDNLLALTHRTLGADHQAQEDHERARIHFGHARRLYGSLGQRERKRKLEHLMRQFGYWRE